MAQQRRMVYGTVFANAELNMLPIEARFLYVGTIVMADDDGRLRADPRFLRGYIFPFDENITSTDVEAWLQKLHEAGQIDLYERDGVKVLRHPKWKDYQKIRADLYAKSKLPPPLRERNDDVTEPLLNISKESKEKEVNEHAHLEYLINLPFEDIKALTAKYDASTAQVKRKAEQFWNYCVSKGKTYKNYRAALENALDKDFGRRVVEKPIETYERQELTPEAVAMRDKIAHEMRTKAQTT